MNYEALNTCIQILNERPKWFFQKEDIAEKLRCFDRIQEIGKPNTISALIGFLKSDNRLIQEKALETILHLFGKLKSLNDYSDSLKYLNISLVDLDFYRVDFDEKNYLQLLRIASLNSSGYLREKAVKEIARLKDINGLKFILLRLSDWVVPVRKSATEATNFFLDAAYINGFLKELPTIEWLLTVKRADLTEIHSRIIKFVLSQEFSGSFSNKIKSLDDKARLCYYRNLFKQKGIYKEQINKIAKDKLFLIRLEVFKHLSTLDITDQKRLIRYFLQDSSVKVKTRALYETKAYAPEFENDISYLLSDESATVRDLSRYLLKYKGVDFLEIYRERINQGQSISGSLMGLSEVGADSDLQIFERYIHSAQSKTITGCLAAINKFNRDKAANYSLELLTHSSNKVRSKAIEILAKSSNSEALEKIRTIYSNGNYEIKKTVLKLFNKIGGWRVIGDFLLSLTDDNVTIQNLGWQFLEKWKFRSTRLFTTPPKHEIERANTILKGLDKYKTKLSNARIALLQDLQFYLR